MFGNVVGDVFNTDIVKFAIGDFLVPVVNIFSEPVFSVIFVNVVVNNVVGGFLIRIWSNLQSGTS